MNPHSDLYSLSPIKFSSQKMLLTPRKQPRAVSKVPYKVLDAPDLADDFYLNLVDWGSQDVLGVGLGNCVYTWSAQSGRVIKLFELEDDTVTSVNWIQRVSSLWYSFSVESFTNASLGLAHCSWHWKGHGSDLGRHSGAAITDNDGTHRPCRRSRLERPHTHLWFSRPINIPP
jgi:hypothetical protein